MKDIDMKNKNLLGILAFMLLFTLYLPVASFADNNGDEASKVETNAKAGVTNTGKQEINEEIIRNYLNQVVELYNQDEFDGDKIIEFIKKHTSKDAKFKVKLFIKDQSKPMIEEYSYDTLLAAIEKSIANASNSRTKIKINKIDYSGDKTNALVNYDLWNTMTIRSRDENSGKMTETKLKSQSNCYEVYFMEDGVLKLRESNCRENVTPLPPRIID